MNHLKKMNKSDAQPKMIFALFIVMMTVLGVLDLLAATAYPIKDAIFQGSPSFASNFTANTFQTSHDSLASDPWAKKSFVTNLVTTGFVGTANWQSSNGTLQAQIDLRATIANFQSSNANLQSQITAKAATNRLLTLTFGGVSYSGYLDADWTKTLPAAGSGTNGWMLSADWISFNLKQAGDSDLTNIAAFSHAKGQLIADNGTNWVLLAPAADGKFIKYDSSKASGIDAVTLSGGGDMVGANNLSDLTDFPTARANLGVSIGTDVMAYASILQQIRTNSWAPGDMIVFDSSTNAQRKALREAVLSYSGTNVTWDVSTYINGALTATNNFRINSITGQEKGLTYGLRIVQDGTGSRIWTYTTTMKFSSAQTLSTNGFDFVSLYCYDGTNFVCSPLIKNPQ